MIVERKHKPWITFSVSYIVVSEEIADLHRFSRSVLLTSIKNKAFRLICYTSKSSALSTTGQLFNLSVQIHDFI